MVSLHWLARASLAVAIQPGVQWTSGAEQYGDSASSAAEPPELAPLGTSAIQCGNDELWLGRFCDRRSGSSSAWYEACLQRKPGAGLESIRAVDATSGDVRERWLAQAWDNLVMAAGEPESEQAAEKRLRLSIFFEQHEYGHSCPTNHVCIQLRDKFKQPFVMCNKIEVPTKENPTIEVNKPGIGRGSFHWVDVRKLAEEQGVDYRDPKAKVRFSVQSHMGKVMEHAVLTTAAISPAPAHAPVHGVTIDTIDNSGQVMGTRPGTSSQTPDNGKHMTRDDILHIAGEAFVYIGAGMLSAFLCFELVFWSCEMCVHYQERRRLQSAIVHPSAIELQPQP